jgi:hypothetical protein
VTFSLSAPKAREVRLEGTFNFWNRQPQDTIILNKDKNGKHEITLYLGEGQWLYRFRVDEKWMIDENNPHKAECENGQYNSILYHRKLIPESQYFSDFKHGNVTQITFTSDILGEQSPVVIYTPPEYTVNTTYPVLFMLHGWGQPPTEWVEAVKIQNYMDNLIAADQIEPFLIVMPSGNTSSFMGTVEHYIIDELYPYIVENYSIIQAKDATAVSGGSMGGLGALHLAYHHQDIFGLSVPLCMSCIRGVCSYDDYKRLYSGDITFQISLYIGAKDEFGFIQNHKNFVKYLEQRDINVTSHIITSDLHKRDGHSVRFYRYILPDVLTEISDFFRKS